VLLRGNLEPMKMDVIGGAVPVESTGHQLFDGVGKSGAGAPCVGRPYVGLWLPA